MRAFLLLALVACQHAAPRRPSVPVLAAPEAWHALARLTFGPRAGDVERLQGMGIERWLDAELAPVPAPAWLPIAIGDGGKREVVQATQLDILARQVTSERQLREVLVDVWTNHFNVFALKGPVRYLAGDFVDRAIRPHATARFADLLVAVAHHPAMLVYLDNARGRNENYARELLELHTVGIDGGYGQADIAAIADLLSGWSVDCQTGAFRFRPRLHQRGTKVVLGERFGDGEAEGERMLRFLAARPETARHVSRKLCARFVADAPPPACVEAAVTAWRKSDGDLGVVVRAIVGSPAFWDPAVRDAKVKTPLELVVSALRAVGARPEGVQLVGIVNRMGQGILLDPVPTGWPDEAAPWLTTSGMLSRMNFAVGLASGRIEGAPFDLGAIAPAAASPEVLVDAIDRRLLGGRASPRTRAVLERVAMGAGSPEQTRRALVALALGSPEFQRQ